MARYTKVLKSLAHNAVGDRRIQAAAPAGNNYYVTGASLNNATDVLTLAVKGASDVTVDLSHLAQPGSPGGSDTQVQFNDGGAFGGSANLTWDDSDLAIGNSGKLKVVNASSNYWAMYNQSNGKMRIDQGTTQRVLASSGEFQFANDIIVDGNLGVGVTPSPTGIAIASGTSKLSFDNTTANAIYRGAGVSFWDSTESYRLQGNTTSGYIQLDMNKIMLVRSASSAASNVLQIGDGSTYDQFSIVEDQRGSSATNGYVKLRAKKTGNDGYRKISLGAISGSTTSELLIDSISTNEALRFDTNSKSHAFDIAKAGYVSVGGAVDNTNQFTVIGTSLLSGNVGIGATPTDKLNINTGVGTFDFRDYNLTYSTSLGIRAESGYLTLATEGANDINLATNGFSNKRLVVKSDGDVGIGTTSPGSKLDIVSTSNDNTGGIRIGDGSTFAAIYHDSSENLIIDPVSDFIVTGSDDVRIQSSDDFELLADDFYFKNDADNSTMMRITSAGNVGIGTSGPYQKLDIRGNLAVDNEINFDMDNNATAYGYINWDGYQGGDTQFRSLWIGDGRRQTQSSLPLAFFDGTTRQVGIGTTTPLAAIHINGGAYQQVFTRGSHNHTIVKGNSDDTLIFATGAPSSHTARFKIQPTGIDVVNDAIITGNVGIGTASPAKTLHIKKDAGHFRISSADYDLISMGPRGNSGSNLDKAAFNMMASDGSSKVYFDTAGDSYINGGNLGIGTASPARKLEVNYGVSSGYMRIVGQSRSLIIGQDSVGASVYQEDNAPMYFATNDTERMRILADGKVGIGTTTPTSDLHVKGELDIQSGNQTILMGGGNSSTARNDNALKLARVGLAHYHNNEEPVGMLYAYSNGTDNGLVIGAGTSAMNSPTKIQFTTAANDATTAGSVRMQIGSDGKVGIGTSSPSTKLDVISTTEQARFGYDSSNYLSLNVDSGGNTIVQAKTGNLELKTDTSAHDVRVDAKGNFRVDLGDSNGGYYTRIRGTSSTPVLMAKSNGLVGIATESPNETLTVEGVLSLDETSAPSATSGYGKIYVKSSDSKLYFMNDSGTETDLTAGGGGTFGGSLSSGKLAIGTGTDTIGNFVDALTENDSIYIGANPASTTNTAQNNTALGISALNDITTGDNNVAIGIQAGQKTTTQERNTIMGVSALRYASGSASYNVAIGYATMGASDQEGSQNTAVGYYALSGATGANAVTAVGHLAARDLTTGDSHVAIGKSAMLKVTTTSYNTVVGVDALSNVDGAGSTTAVGFGAMKYSSADNATGIGQYALSGATGDKNAALGNSAGAVAKGSANSVMVGYQAGFYPTGNYNTWMGWKAGYGVEDGAAHSNVGVGREAARNTSSGYSNTSIGYQTSYSMTTGAGNTHIGNQAGFSGSTHNNTTFIGNAAGLKNTSNDNVAIGAEAYLSGSSATQIVAIGRNAGKGITTGQGIIAIGPNAAQESEASTHNVAIGWQAMYGASGDSNRNIGIGTSTLLDITTGDSNVGVGYQAAQNVTSGGYNIAIGNNALATATTSTGSVAIGHNAGKETTVNETIHIGKESGYSSIGSGSVFVGHQSGYFPHGDKNVYVGWKAGKGDSSTTSNSQNVGVGSEALTSISDGDENVAVGDQAGYSISTGDYNVGLGSDALRSVTTGHGNVGIGRLAGSILADHNYTVAIGYGAAQDAVTTSSVIIGHSAGYNNNGGDNNVFIGKSAGVNVTTGGSNVMIGPNAGPSSTSTTSNELYIHNSQGSTPLIKGDFSAPSLTVNGDLGVTGSLSVTGSTLAVQREMKNDITLQALL